MAQRGAWIEYDGIGGGPDDAAYIDYLRRMTDAGFEDQILLSQDRGWYDPGTPERPPLTFTYLCGTFLPKLSAAGFDDVLIRQWTHSNPFRAFAR
jgi:phosphotriesterase-related protein